MAELQSIIFQTALKETCIKAFLINSLIISSPFFQSTDLVRCLSFTDEKLNRPSHVALNMMTTNKTAKKIIQALDEARAFSDEVQAMVFSSSAKAFTFRA